MNSNINWYSSFESITNLSISLVKRSRTALKVIVNSLWRRLGAEDVSLFFWIFSHNLVKNSISIFNFSFGARSLTVLTMKPAPGDLNFCISFFNRILSFSSSILREIPIWSTVGIYTRWRPGRLMWEVARAPFVPNGSLETWTKVFCPSCRRPSILISLSFIKRILEGITVSKLLPSSSSCNIICSQWRRSL